MTVIRSIAVVSPRFLEGATVGGAETLLRTLARYAAESGIAVTFLATCARNPFTWANELPAGATTHDGLTVRRFAVDGDRDIAAFLRVQNRICRGRRVSAAEEHLWLRHNVNSTALIDHLRREGAAYDRILMGPYLFGLIHAAAAVHPDRTVLVPCLHDEAFAYLGAFREMFQRARSCLFNAVPERELAARLFGSAMRRMPVVGMGIPAFEPGPPGWAAQHGVPTPYVLYAGRREPLKGTPLLLDYLDTFHKRTGREVSLALIGSGAIEPPPTLVPRLHDLGFVSETDKRRAMAEAAVFCHPSVNESFGIVLLEAWMAATPALVHAGSAVLTHQCRESNGGLWFRNYPEFEDALALLLDRDDLRRAMGQAGQRYVREQFDETRVRDRMLQALAAG